MLHFNVLTMQLQGVYPRDVLHNNVTVSEHMCIYITGQFHIFNCSVHKIKYILFL